MLWIQIFARVIPIILLIALGAFLKRSRFLSEQTIGELKKFVVNVCLPALLFIAFLNTEFQPRHLWIILIMFLVNFLMLLVGRAFHATFAKENAYFPLMFTGFEMGMLGFSLFGAVYGVQSLSTMGILDLGQEVYVWFVLTTLLLGLRDGAANLGKTALSFISSPVIIGILLGVALNLLGLKALLTSNALLGGLFTTVTLLSQLTIPLILVIIGCQLNFSLFEFRLPMITLILRMLVLVIIAVLLNIFVFDRLLHLPRPFSMALFTMFILPPPFIIPLFMPNKKGFAQDYVGNTLSLGTIMTLVAFIILITVYR
jgi:malate permease and related proteins